ncbi:MAG: glutamate ligase domain-containing protein, partial [Solirubrobacterales bacterium]
EADFDASGSSCVLEGPEGSLPVRTPLPGHFNVANALGAIAAAASLGVSPPEAAVALAGAGRVPGRFEPIDEGQAFGVLVDYAHTPDSLANVLTAARRLTAGRLISVFGAGGDRDRDKRPKMGRVGAELSDITVITSDNPRSEEPDAIIAEILSGAGENGVEVEPDRRAGRHGADRRPGPRAGPGVRGWQEDPLRRPRGRAG